MTACGARKSVGCGSAFHANHEQILPLHHIVSECDHAGIMQVLDASSKNLNTSMCNSQNTGRTCCKKPEYSKITYNAL
jgi:hypothetical protein